MRLVSAKEFHDRVTRVLSSKEAVVVTTRGKVTGYYIPHKERHLPPDVRWKIIEKAASEMREALKKQGVTEKEILEDFERWRKNNRASRHRR